VWTKEQVFCHDVKSLEVIRKRLPQEIYSKALDPGMTTSFTFWLIVQPFMGKTSAVKGRMPEDRSWGG